MAATSRVTSTSRSVVSGGPESAQSSRLKPRAGQRQAAIATAPPRAMTTAPTTIQANHRAVGREPPAHPRTSASHPTWRIQRAPRQATTRLPAPHFCRPASTVRRLRESLNQAPILRVRTGDEITHGRRSKPTCRRRQPGTVAARDLRTRREHSLRVHTESRTAPPRLLSVTSDGTPLSTFARRRHEVKRTPFRAAVVPTVPTVAEVALGLGLSACAAGNESSGDAGSASTTSGSKLSGTLNGTGSSAQEAAQGAWQSGFQSANPEVTGNYDPVGSGGGREQFLAGGVDFAGSDSYLSEEELAASKKACHGQTALEVPNYVSPIALVYNVSGVDKLQLSAKTAAMIFAGKITKWNDPAIKADNPGTNLPADRIVPVHRSDDSGTSKNFTEWLSKAGQAAWSHEPDSLWPVKGGEGAQGTSGVIQPVTNGKGTIGYADASQAGNLSVASIKVGDAYVAPSAEAAAKVVDLSKRVSGRAANDVAVDIDRTTTEAGAYPLILTSYVIACPTYADKAKASLVKNYLSYLLSSDGQAAAAKTAGSAPLSSTLSSGVVAVADKISATS